MERIHPVHQLILAFRLKDKGRWLGPRVYFKTEPPIINFNGPDFAEHQIERVALLGGSTDAADGFVAEGAVGDACVDSSPRVAQSLFSLQVQKAAFASGELMSDGSGSVPFGLDFLFNRASEQRAERAERAEKEQTSRQRAESIQEITPLVYHCNPEPKNLPPIDAVYPG